MPLYAAHSASSIVAFPRAGIETGHFRLSAAYYILSNHESFGVVKAGFFFGGGHKRYLTQLT